MINTDVFRSIRNSVCAVVVGGEKLWNYNDDEEKPSDINYSVIGTGFLAAENLILTNRHVFDAIKSFDPNYVAVVFTHVTSENEIGQSLLPLKNKFVISESPNPEDQAGKTIGTDIAFFQLDDESALSIGINHRKVDFGTRDRVHISTPIGICGYIHGDSLLGYISDQTTVRYSPTLLQGHIAGLAPFDNLPNMNLKLILTDITNGGGLSGSPLFTEDGRVIGVHCAGRTEHVYGPKYSNPQETEIKLITQGIGYAVPFTQESMTLILKTLEKAKIELQLN